MRWFLKYISEDEIKKVSQAVQAAEAHTSGEIVPVIVRRSSAVGHVPLLLTLLMVVAILFVENPLREHFFETPWIYAWPVLIVLMYFINVFLAHLPTAQRLLTPDHDEEAQVMRRAQLEFYLNRVNMTSSSTGILIFISIMERKAVILGDEGITTRIGNEKWHELVKSLSQQLKKGQWGPGLIECIGHCGELLTTHFPMASHDRNELSNQLVIKE